MDHSLDAVRVRSHDIESAPVIARELIVAGPELRQARNWFSLYFIPVIPLNQIGQFVTCLVCGTNFQKDVLVTPITSNTPVDRFAREAQADMDSGTPIEMVRQKLINTGLSRELVDHTIETAAGLDRLICPADHLTYRTTAQRCAQCGSLLQNQPRI